MSILSTYVPLFNVVVLRMHVVSQQKQFCSFIHSKLKQMRAITKNSRCMKFATYEVRGPLLDKIFLKHTTD